MTSFFVLTPFSTLCLTLSCISLGLLAGSLLKLRRQSLSIKNAQQQINQLNIELATAKTRLEQQSQLDTQLKTQFQAIAQDVLEQKNVHLNTQNHTALEALLKPFREQITGFQQRVDQVHTEAVRSHASLNSEIKKVMDIGLKITNDANNLTNALKGDKKALGNWGEMQLERSLELAGLEPDVHFTKQTHFKNEFGKSLYPDFLIKLPDQKHLVIDSKASLVSYDKAVSANSPAEKSAALDEHIKALKRHIDDLSSKEYSQLDGVNSPSFVLMFLPIEPAYIEALKHQATLFDYGYRKNIVLVSHTTLMPILTTIANLWRQERSHSEVKAISDKAGEIYNQVCLVTERVGKIGGSLNTLSQHYNQTVKALTGQQGLHGKVERFKTVSTKATKHPAKLESMHPELELVD